MLVAISYYSGDRHLAESLARWIADLGGVKKHTCLLVVDRSTTPTGVIEPLLEAFAKVDVVIAEPVGEQGKWGTGTVNAEAANEGWLTAMVNVAHKYKCPWFWMEVDAAPTRSTWLDEIEAEYQRGRKPFMGALVDWPGIEKHMTGIGVYPAEVAKYSLKMATPGTIAWDYAGRDDTVNKGKAHFCNLIQHEYRIDGVSPTFPTLESLNVIRKEAAIFHRCKSTELVGRLRERASLIRAGNQTGKTNIPEAAGFSNESPILRTQIKELENEVATLKARIESLTLSQFPETIAQQHDRKKTRTPEEQKIIDQRMAKARAGRKKGVPMKRSPKAATA